MRLKSIYLCSTSIAVFFAVVSMGSEVQSGARGLVITSLAQIVRQSDVIAEVQVDSVFPPYELNRLPNGYSSTGRDALYKTGRILKGSQTPTEFVAGQLVGTSEGSRHGTPGERYIVFLRTAPPNALQALPQRSVPRYEVVGGHLGFVGIDDKNNVQLSSELPFYGVFNQRSKDAFISEITALVLKP